MSEFSELQVDPLVGAEVMTALDVHPEDLQDARTFNKLHDILEYVKNIPDRGFFINKALAGKNVNRLDHLAGLVQLHKQLDSKKKELETLEEQIGFYNK